MRFIDLTHRVHQALPVYPGDDPVKLEQVNTIDSDGFSNYTLSTGMHAGTHIDGPAHMIPGSANISGMPLTNFAGQAVLIDVRGEMTLSIKEAYDTLPLKSIVLFHSGLDILFEMPEYHTNHPVFTRELALFLIEKEVKMVGIDWASPDYFPYPIHKLLLENNILLLENLTRLEQIPEHTPFELFAFPLSIDADSSMVRAVARLQE